ncbi:MAG: STAS domain-containing protein [Planctomycetota bacterium]
MADINITTVKLPDDIVLASLEGIITSTNTDEFEQNITRLFDEDIYRIIFDMSKLTMISSSGIGALIKILGTCKEHHGNIVIVQPHRSVEESSIIFGLFNFVPLAKDVNEAVKIILRPPTK